MGLYAYIPRGIEFLKQFMQATAMFHMVLLLVLMGFFSYIGFVVFGGRKRARELAEL